MVILIHLLALLLLLFLLILPVYLLSDFLAGFKGAPFVPTSAGFLKEIFEKAGLKKGQRFLELGSGDGRVTRFVVKKYRIEGTGVDLNPVLVHLSRILAKAQRLNHAQFQVKNFFKVDFAKFDLIFLFLMPGTVEKLKPKFLKECQQGTLIISHGFEIYGFERLMVDKIQRRTFSTYYYKI